MDSLENEQHKSRLQLFFMISLGAYFFWFSQWTPPAVQQPVEVEEVSSTEVVKESSEENIQSVEQAQVPTSTVAAHSVSVKQGMLDLEVSSKYGSPSFVGLTKYTEPPVNQSWWGWVFSGMEGEWTPYSAGEDELKVLTDKGALVVLGEDDKAFEDVFTVTQQANKIQAKGQVNGLEITQEYLFSKSDIQVEGHIVDILLTISNHRSVKTENLWIGVYDYMNS